MISSVRFWLFYDFYVQFNLKKDIVSDTLSLTAMKLKICAKVFCKLWSYDFNVSLSFKLLYKFPKFSDTRKSC